MNFVSTRKKSPAVSASEAILQGLAPDGGLYIPETFPSLENLRINEISSYPELAFEVLYPFFETDILKDDLAEICIEAFNFPVPLVQVKDKQTILELYHGPTAAFKDFGARFLACAMEKLLEKQERKLTILVATSGDTGGAVAAAFANRKGIEVKVLFPKGRVSKRQKQQLTCWGGNIKAYEVDGSFDDCQKMVKDAFMDTELKETWGLSSANSINLGRLLPQSVYYVYAAHLFSQSFGIKPTFIIPSGNVGNSCGAYWAFSMGAPIERIALAVNANKTIPDYLEEGEYKPRSSVATLANAMDVGSPSNMERLFALYGDIETFRRQVSAWSVDDETIKQTIKEVYDENGYILCPHTATAERVRRDHFADKGTIVVSTAHPAKFEAVVEPLIGKEVPVPENLAALFDKKSEYKSVGCNYKELFVD
ncbi:threonine synthase [Sphaerochaeta pleomorpha str. Grapes]|uniref:Threonine synthase n=1 Tax=Sphaerochaeta pleomorpha (strain ATCC BAA-1885 / DSM 22778 / Grapes) TaxID=158190 RepID=G8QSZ7_SPHPG|nr:threonine synthase [Sphaerochaeta pleomorpha]AEV27902.1 threonine synthase [Sphaerochaeta pleomorpha str. Grapes]